MGRHDLVTRDVLAHPQDLVRVADVEIVVVGVVAVRQQPVVVPACGDRDRPRPGVYGFVPGDGAQIPAPIRAGRRVVLVGRHRLDGAADVAPDLALAVDAA